MRNGTSLTRRFVASRAAVSAIEFALVLPVLILLLLGGFQLILYVNATRSVETVAASIAQMISEKAPPSNATTTALVNATDLHFSFDSTMVLFPYVLRDAKRQGVAWWQDIGINFAGINFKKQSNATCIGYDQSACYTAQVAWTSTGTAGGNYRACNSQQSPVNDNSTPTSTTLPRSVFGANSIIAIDVAFLFRPTFAAQILPPIRIARSIFVQPRYASAINFDTTNNDGIATSCS